jgi:dTDP-4-amino-4,6-dideoxygalactose transaminase
MKSIPLSDIDMGEEEINSVIKVLKSKWLSMGPVTEEFERDFSNYLSIKHAFGVSNCTAALHLANKVMGVGPGDEVIVPSLSFVATANATLYCGGKPVFADITSPENLNISPDDILEKITPKTRAITTMHYAGYPCDMDSIMEIANDHNLKVIEDVAHAPGAEYKGRKCGTIGDIGCFSFFANKNIVTGEGGMIVTDDDLIAPVIKQMRSHSMTSLTWDRHKGHSYSYDVTDVGYNYRINEIASTLGRIQLKKLDENNKSRESLTQTYIRSLDSPKISIPFKDHPGKSSYHIFPIILSSNVSRNEFMTELKGKGIQTSVHYPPIHLFTYYREKFGFSEGMLPKTEFVGENEVTLPLHPKMSKEDIEFVIESVNEF